MKKFQWVFYMFGWCLLLGGCANDVLDNTSANETGKVKLMYTVPEMAGTQTRADDESDHKIHEILLLFFDATSNGAGRYVGMFESKVENNLPNGVEFLAPTGDPGEPAIATNKSYNVWAIANFTSNGLTKEMINALASAPGTTERTLKSSLQVSNPTNLSWPLLMSGTSVMSGKDKTIAVELRRNVARLDLYNDNVGFELYSLRLTNIRRSSYVMDMNGAFPLDFFSESTKVTTDTSLGFLRLYAFENYAEEAPDKELYGVVGLKNGAGEIRYYRTSINRQNLGSNRFVQRISRNTSYTLRIVSVTGSGSTTWEDAAKGELNLTLLVDSPLWDESFDGMYTYSSNGIGFATSLGGYQKEVLSILSLSSDDKKVDVKLYWSNRGEMMTNPPTDLDFNAEFDGNSVMSFVSPPDRNNIQCEIVGYGKAILTVTYNGVSREIPFEIRSLPMSPVIIDNTIVSMTNAGVDADNPRGKLYTYNEAMSKTVPVCPNGWRLPTYLELLSAQTKGALKVGESGVLLTDGKGAMTLFPAAGYKDTPAGDRKQDGSIARYWTSSVDRIWQGALPYPPNARFVESDGTNLVFKGTAAAVNSQMCYSVRCVATLDDPNTNWIIGANKDRPNYEVTGPFEGTYRQLLDNIPPGWRMPAGFEIPPITEDGRIGVINDRWYIYENITTGFPFKPYGLDLGGKGIEAGSTHCTFDANKIMVTYYVRDIKK